MHPNGGKVTLLSLPMELRDMIYSHLLIRNEAINLSVCIPHVPNDDEACEATKSFNALSRTCRQTQQETADVFLKNNTFSFIANIALPSIPVQYVRKMRHVSLHRTLVGKTFRLNIRLQPNCGVSTDFEVIGRRQSAAKPNVLQTTLMSQDMITFRLTQGATFATKMLQRSTNEQGGLSMGILRAVATQMNQQWLIAM